MSWFVQAIAGAVLEWLTSLWDRFTQKQANIEQGRREVREEVRDKTEKIKDEWREIRDNPVAVDAAFDELRALAERDASKNNVSKTGTAASISGRGAAKGQ